MQKGREKYPAPLMCELVAHACYDYDDDKNPKNHIKIEVTAAETSAAAVISFTALSHCEFLLSMFCNIYYDYSVNFAFCPHVLLEFFLEIG